MLGVLCIFSQGTGDAIDGIIYGLLSGFGFALLTVFFAYTRGRILFRLWLLITL